MHLKNKTTFLFIALLLVSSGVYSQTFPEMEDSLRKMKQHMVTRQYDFERLSMNLEFKEYFEEVLNTTGAFDYPFDSLKSVSFLKDPDEKFRIITWYVPMDENTFEYFGYFQFFDEKDKKHYLYELTDRMESVPDIHYQTLQFDNWYGAYYTELIHERHKRKDYYILLGWRGDNSLSRKRIIEPIRIMGKGKPTFGRPVFRYKDNKYRRVIFEYSSRVSMTLKFEEQYVEKLRKQTNLIVFDRLLPQKDFLKGKYQFYVPETNVFDGFYFDDGNWNFVKDIDARNAKRRLPLIQSNRE